MRVGNCVIFFSICYFSNGLPVQRGTRQAGEIDLDKYLQTFGYMEPDKSDKTVSSTTRAEALKEFQRWNSLHITGTLDNTTMELINTPRCGLPDNKIPKGSFALGSKWNKKSLTYRITGETPDLSSAPLRSELARAFKFWTDVADIEITKTSCSNSDIVMSFETWDHNDGAPFDGEGGTLAHAFFPPRGVCHFDDSETWMINRTGHDLFIVAAHEVGHLLGLHHTNDRSALMYPYYFGYIAGYTIPAYDKAAIIAHYGRGTTREVVKRNDMTPKQLPCSASLVIRGNISVLLSMIAILYYFDIFIIS